MRMQASFNKLLLRNIVFLRMNRCLLVLITAFTITSSFAQSDFIQLKKNNKVLKTWFKDNYITLQLKNDQWLDAVIYKIKDDSLFLRPYVVNTYMNRLGLNFLDTTYYGLMVIHISYVKAFPKDDEGFEYVKNGTIFKIAGGGYALLNVINTLSNHEAVFGSDNLPKILIALGVFAVGEILSLTHKREYVMGKKYHIEYISVKPS
jgi:hypothetical protein